MYGDFWINLYNANPAATFLTRCVQQLFWISDLILSLVEAYCVWLLTVFAVFNGVGHFVAEM
jgi:hypothetical protein